MIVLTIRTDNPEAELGLYDDARQLAYLEWQAHKQLAETIHTTISALLHENAKQISDIQGIVVFQGPGSFTGLRIGTTVANALASSLQLPIAGTTGDDWIAIGLQALQNHPRQQIILPKYGSDPHITLPKH